MVVALCLIAGGVAYVFEYNNLVKARYSLENLEKNIKEAKTRESEIKNSIYQITDPEKIKKVAEENALILEEMPAYISEKTEKTLSKLIEE